MLSLADVLVAIDPRAERLFRVVHVDAANGLEAHGVDFIASTIGLVA